MPSEDEAPIDPSPVDVPVQRRFTWRELSKLNKRHNAHVAYRGKVYDVSEFVNRHPGGAEQILLGAGRDITQLFESYHNLEVVGVLKKFYVGELVDNELPVFPEMGEFYTTLRKRVDNFFKINNLDPKFDYWMFLRYITFIFLSYASYCLLLSYHSYWIPGIFFSICWGFFSGVMTMTCGHDASHFAITHNKWIWLLVSIPPQFMAFSLYVWNHQHVIAHHSYTNIEGADPDIATSEMDLRRIKWSQKWFPYYFYQHVYLPMIYGFIGIRTWILDIIVMIKLDVFSFRVNPPSALQWFVFVGCKVVYVVLRLVIPYFYMPWTSLVLYNLITELSFSVWLGLTSQSSHVSSEVQWPHPDKNNVFHGDWAEFQVSTTKDFATDSWFWTVFTGVLNHQTVHHLFPGIIQSHYPKIRPIIEQTCKEFGVKYNHTKSGSQAIGEHLGHLKKLGQAAFNFAAKRNDAKES